MNGSPRIGVLGGSFDPIHLGHLIIAEEAATRLGLDSVVFVPAYNQWRKVEAGVAEAEHRLAMTRLAVEDNAQFSVSPVDIQRKGPTYSVDTLRDVGAEAPVDAELYFLLGADALQDLPHWNEPRRLSEMARFGVFSREATPLDWAELERLIPGLRERTTLLDIPLIGISSSEVRKRVAAGESIRYWVPDKVAAYIQQHDLYKEASG